MNRALVKLSEMFATPNHTQVELVEPAMTAKAFLMNNRARTSPILTDGTSAGVKAWYLRGAHNPVAAADSCTTPAGVYSGTLATNYDNEQLAGDSQRALSARCDNELTFADEMAFQMRLAMASCRKQLNNTIISRMNSQAQANIADPLPSAWTESGTTIEVPAADFTFDNIGEFERVATQNLLGGQYFMVTGSNFYNQFKLATAYGQSPEGQARMKSFGEFNMFFDARYLDAQVTVPATFGVEYNSFAFWNHYWGSSVPTEITVGSSGRKMEFFVEDPELMYMKDGRLTPVIYMAEVEEACASRNANTQIQIQYNIYLRLIGGFKFSPDGVDSASNTVKGVVKFVKA